MWLQVIEKPEENRPL